jgi:hypothetical protein
MTERYFGLHRGTVVDNADPQAQMRVRVLVPAILGESVSPWALPCVPPGVTTVPEIGTGVWIAFECGDPLHPVWIGTVGPVDAPPGDAP